MEQQQVPLEILGREFLIKSSPEKQQALLEAVNLLKQTAEKINTDNPNQGLNRILVLSALTIAADYLSLKNDTFEPQLEAKEQIHRLQQQIELALTAEKA